MLMGFITVIPQKGHEEIVIQLNKIRLLLDLVEIQSVATGFRKAATTHVSQDNLNKRIPQLNKLGLVFTPLRSSGYYEGFNHIHKPIKPGDPFFWYGCVTRSYKDGQEFYKADNPGGHCDHEKVGRLLGFPKCCTEYFAEHYINNYDPIWMGRSGDVTGYWTNNDLLRYFGPRALFHFSCSPDCEATHTKSLEWLHLMAKNDKKTTLANIALLKSPVTWDSYHGAIIIKTPQFTGITNGFPGEKRIIKFTGTD
jgi:hypothetical protein